MIVGAGEPVSLASSDLWRRDRMKRLVREEVARMAARAIKATILDTSKEEQRPSLGGLTNRRVVALDIGAPGRTGEYLRVFVGPNRFCDSRIRDLRRPERRLKCRANDRRRSNDVRAPRAHRRCRRRRLAPSHASLLPRSLGTGSAPPPGSCPHLRPRHQNRCLAFGCRHPRESQPANSRAARGRIAAKTMIADQGPEREVGFRAVSCGIAGAQGSESGR